MKQLFTILFFFTCISTWARSVIPKAGVWRLTINYPHIQIPFMLEFEAQKRGWKAILINGKEHIVLDEIKATSEKWIIPLGTYQNFLEIKFPSKTTVAGFFVKGNKFPNERIPLSGNYGQIRRFAKPALEQTINLNGKWSLELTNPEGQKQNVIAVFGQTGQTLDATILTPTGDLRYLDGYVSGNKFEVAGFDGVFNYVFKGELIENDLKGELISKGISTFTGKINPKAQLEESITPTTATDLNFSFPDMNGKNIQLTDEHYKDKAVIIQIFGSWCPNCLDETQFLSEWYVTNAKKNNVEIICLAFEYHQDQTSALKHLKKFVLKKHVPYPVLLAGWSSDDKPGDKIPGLKNFLAFPTTLFLNKKHQVIKVHSGFSGPGTGDYFTQYKNYFSKTIDEMIK